MAARHVLAGPGALCWLAVSHEGVRALLPAYAAGALEEVGSEAVQAHLAAGCAECLEEVFRHPVGLPREAVGVAAVPARTAPWRRAAVLAAVLAGLYAGLAAWLVAAERGRVRAEREAADLAGQLGAIEARRAALEERVDVLGRELAGARAEAGRQADAVRATAEESAEVRRQLELAEERITALARSLRRRDREVDRLLSAATERELLAAPGAELLRLEPVAPFRDVQGHVLWEPARDTIVLHAFGLPGGRRYAVRLGVDDGSWQRGPAFWPEAEGTAVVSIRLPVAPDRLRAVEVVLEPAAQAVLAGGRTLRGP